MDILELKQKYIGQVYYKLMPLFVSIKEDANTHPKFKKIIMGGVFGIDREDIVIVHTDGVYCVDVNESENGFEILNITKLKV